MADVSWLESKQQCNRADERREGLWRNEIYLLTVWVVLTSLFFCQRDPKFQRRHCTLFNAGKLMFISSSYFTFVPLHHLTKTLKGFIASAFFWVCFAPLISFTKSVVQWEKPVFTGMQIETDFIDVITRPHVEACQKPKSSSTQDSISAGWLLSWNIFYLQTQLPLYKDFHTPTF